MREAVNAATQVATQLEAIWETNDEAAASQLRRDAEEALVEAEVTLPCMPSAAAATVHAPCVVAVHLRGTIQGRACVPIW